MVEIINVDTSGIQILSYLLAKGKSNFNEIVRQTGLSSRTVSIQLKKLEKDGMIEKIKTGDGKFSKVLYDIAEKGKAFIDFCIEDDEDLRSVDREKLESIRMFEKFILELLDKMRYSTDPISLSEIRIKDWYSFIKAIRIGVIQISDNTLSFTRRGFSVVANILKRRLDTEISYLEFLRDNVEKSYDEYILKSLENSLNLLKQSSLALNKFCMLLDIEMQEEFLKELKEKLLTDKDMTNHN